MQPLPSSHYGSHDAACGFGGCGTDLLKAENSTCIEASLVRFPTPCSKVTVQCTQKLANLQEFVQMSLARCRGAARPQLDLPGASPSSTQHENLEEHEQHACNSPWATPSLSPHLKSMERFAEHPNWPSLADHTCIACWGRPLSLKLLLSHFSPRCQRAAPQFAQASQVADMRRLNALWHGCFVQYKQENLMP